MLKISDTSSKDFHGEPDVPSHKRNFNCNVNKNFFSLESRSKNANCMYHIERELMN